MLSSDIRAAWRSLVRQPFATGLAIGMLALGIAASVAVFTLVNGIFLRPFPVPEPDRLVYINETAPKWNLEYVGINYPDFDQWRKDQRLFEAIALHDTATFNLADGPSVERVQGAQITRDFFQVLRMPPLVGRTFTAEEDRPNGTPAVMISEALWRERFGADPAVIGRTLRLDSAPRTIVGVVAARADFGFRASVWVPLAGDPAQTYENYSWTGIGRLKPRRHRRRRRQGPATGASAHLGHEGQGPQRQPVRPRHAGRADARLRRHRPGTGRCRRDTAAGGLRQRRQRHAGARAQSQARDGHPARHRRQPHATAPSVVRREHPAGRGRRRAGAAAGELGA